MKGASPRLCRLALIGAALAAYGNSLGGGFLFDDTDSIVRNPTIRRLWPVGDALSPPHLPGWTVDGRPILNLSLAFNYAFGGAHVWGYHAFNLLVHILAGLLLFEILRWTFRRTGAAASAELCAFGAALLWSVHPLQTEAVSYVIQRAESLMGLFYLLTLYAFSRYAAENRTRWAWVSIAACFLGMGTKEVMVTAPVMVLCFDRAFVAGSFRAALRRRGSYFLGLAATWTFLLCELAGTGFNRGGSKGFGAGYSWWAWERTQFEALVHYLRLAAWPHPLIFSYGPLEIGVERSLPYAAAVAALAAATLWALARNRPGGFLGLWYFGILAVTSFAPASSDMITERRMYLPLAAVVAAVVPVLFARAGRLALVACLATATAFGALTWSRNRDYRDEAAIWNATVAARPGNPYAQYMAGVQDFNQGRGAEEIARYREAIRLKPDFFEAERSLANALAHQGRPQEAIAQFEAALAINPLDPVTQCDFGTVLYGLGRASAAMARYREAIRLQPDYPQAHDNLGVALAAGGRPGEAIAEFDAALKGDPALLRAHVNLAGALATLGRLPGAAAQYESALRLDPNFEPAHFFLGNVLCQEGRFADAIAQYEAALRLDPGDANARANLQIARAQR